MRTKALVCAFRGLVVERDEEGKNRIREKDLIYGAGVGRERQARLAEAVITGQCETMMRDLWILE